jgi:hypothetical protein
LHEKEGPERTPLRMKKMVIAQKPKEPQVSVSYSCGNHDSVGEEHVESSGLSLEKKDHLGEP